ncbi:glycogen/starch/alpha-glucan phosphorylase [Clostridium tertium]|jgi:starch phosphorylase|uniref:glycogen/starch/alpha-glucan phosphorylase n=1 Tax=Clostridium TaxID=1485 RepID=UPI001C1E6DF4|nr:MULTISPECIES: glycogen/starch/alpha-glucan phosphorylase [Clostridium]MBS5305487.1 glycogen/starch/alpha-glucan phosphorylase [Clostridium sp.]MBU6136553.1 glycogen/starch/alpha-glucan family phosphorylase [Clostridium tertium]MDB1939816.1 glycogen/starch/alpha-glucan phosphorylase [Clostridium tertium]MDB1943233.1 glycogen/starch/alpha-glucan phosphorylase [Clostridium tertium]MDB1950334.1 glycogen/starch/alpha-glucan phosphorylase [Clostridium tertium]
MVQENLTKILEKRFDKTIKEASNEEIYLALLELTKGTINKKGTNKGDKKLYYISAEFLIGKLLSNNLINLGLYEEVKEVLSDNGKELTEIEEIELEPSLGNGGLGRLAACFLDSIATLGLNGDGVGLNYHFGLFQQVFENNKQKAVKNPWITSESWLNKSDIKFEVLFGGFKVISSLYDIDVTGYDKACNKLRLFDIDTIDETLVKDGINFNKEEIKKNLTLFLYPDDSDKAGHLLRIYQQYFMVSNAAQLILLEAEENGYDLHKLYDHVVIQINDTHPSMVIPELIRLLGERGIGMEEAIEIVTKTCAYTNHTILAEALEKWPIEYLDKVVPQLMPIIRELDNKVKAKYDDEKVYIIDKDNRVHMAHMDIHYGFSVNGVAALHTEILKEEELKQFYNIYPEKFNNKTNGITFRRWLIHCNNELAKYISELIGDDYKKDATKLENLLKYIDNKEVLKKLGEIKKNNKIALKNYLKETQGVEIDENSIFDIQIKRLHEYKRQQMNVLYIIHKYLDIKNGNIPETPITMIFGAKAAPAYIIAQDIIHTILCLQEIINNDPEVNKYLKVVMVENYNVTKASKLIPACDVSEQISLASKEASGTGNMKFMLNGALTLGTEDGANVEIHELVGDDNIYIFGESSETVIEHYKKADYVSKKYYEKPAIKELVDFIVSDEMIAVGDKENLTRLHKELINKDWFMTLLDLEDYIKTKEIVFKDYEDRETWNRKVLFNISKAGFFSSDRTIEQYNKEIWKLK